MSAVGNLVDAGSPITLKAILADLENHDYECLYFTNEKQIESIEKLDKYDGITGMWLDCKEELAIMTNELMQDLA